MQGILDFLVNLFWNRNRYRRHSEAVIVACYYNPQNSPYRLLAFQKWYHSIKHLPHRIVECVIGDAKAQIPASFLNDPDIIQVHADTLLWHKEALLNKIIKDLPEQFKYVFWVDADVIFTNLNWIVDGVAALQRNKIIQPFEYCVHLDRNQMEPSFDVDAYRGEVRNIKKRHPKLWRSFCANCCHPANAAYDLAADENYDVHGHVGFAWGARRSLLEACPLYDKALIGGADHIIAHAAAGHIGHKCITKSFTDDLDEVLKWSKRFYNHAQGSIGYVPGDLYHIWHGDIEKRQYLKRIKDFTEPSREITEKDANGLYVGGPQHRQYMQDYFRHREVFYDDFDGFDEGFLEEFGYQLAYFIEEFGPPAFGDLPPEYEEAPPETALPITDSPEVQNQRAILEQQFPDRSTDSPEVQNQRDILERAFPEGHNHGRGEESAVGQTQREILEVKFGGDNENFS